MTRSASRRTFGKGLNAVGRARYLEALAYFEAAMQIEARSGARAPMRYLSYYGLCLAMVSRRIDAARQICERAVRAEFFNPDLYLNLGRVCARGGDRQAAFSALVRGLHLNPRHGGLIREIRRMGIRRRPVVQFLNRGNPVNRVLGRLRSTTGSPAAQHQRVGS